MMTSNSLPRRHRRLAVLLAAGALAATAAAAPLASATTSVPAQAHFRGTSYGQLAAQWWNWDLSIPLASNPTVDTTGTSCALGATAKLGGTYPGSPYAPDLSKVWLLSGSGFSSGGTDPGVVRSCTVPTGTPLFVVAFDTLWSYPTGDSEPFAAQANARLDLVANDPNGPPRVTVDGKPVNVVRALSPRYTVHNTADPFDWIPTYGWPASGAGVAGGFYALLHPLPAGQHVVHATAFDTAEGFNQDITYNITVVPGR